MSNFAIPGLMPIDSPKADGTPDFIKLTPHYASDTNWIGMEEIGPHTMNDEAPTLVAARVVMEFFSRVHYEPECVVFDSDEGGAGIITILDAPTWYFSVPVQPLPLPPGMWEWLIRVYDSEGAITKIHEGSILILP